MSASLNEAQVIGHLGKAPEIVMDGTVMKRFLSKIQKTETCWIWRGRKSSRGYGHVHLRKGSGGSQYVHRLVYKLLVGPIPEGMIVCHRCDNPPCCNPDHLFLGTHQDNIADRHAKRRDASGERSGAHTHPEKRARGERSGARLHPESVARGIRHGNAKLTEENVLAIRAEYVKGCTSYPKLARKYGVSFSQVAAIVSRRKWKHLTNKEELTSVIA